MHGYLQDVRYALRTLRKSPGFAAVASLTLALGIGATTIIFSAIDGILIEPFPYKNANRLTSFYIHDSNKPKENGRAFFTMPEFMDFREGNQVFEDMMGTAFVDVLYTKNDETQLFSGSWVTPNRFDFLGIGPLMGRWVTAEDVRPGAPPIFMMSYRLWKEHFNQDPRIVGTTFTLNRVPRTLVAIMPPRYLPANSDVWMPIALTHSEVMGDSGFPLFFAARGRLKPGVTLDAAAMNLGLLAQHFSAVYARDYPKQFTVITKTFADNLIKNKGKEQRHLSRMVSSC